MNTERRDKFIRLWAKYFNNSELPITFQYSDSTLGVPILEAPDGHRCIVAQLLRARRGDEAGVGDLRGRQKVHDVHGLDAPAV